MSDIFFIAGISQGQKQFDYVKSIVCQKCRKFGRLEVFVTYSYFSLFFIPIIKWDKRYYAKRSCCNTIYSLNSELGKEIEKGMDVDIRQEDLHELYGCVYRTCPQCGYETENNRFVFCPMCGYKFVDQENKQ